jgi:hypothetical protein
VQISAQVPKPEVRCKTVLEVAALEFDDMVMTLVVLPVSCLVRFVPRDKQTHPALGDGPAGSLVVAVLDRKSQVSKLTETDCVGRMDEILLVLDDISAAVAVVAVAAAVRTEQDDRMIDRIRGGGCLQSPPCGRGESHLVDTVADAKYNADTQKNVADTIAVADGACFELQDGIAKDELRHRFGCEGGRVVVVGPDKVAGRPTNHRM